MAENCSATAAEIAAGLTDGLDAAFLPGGLRITEPCFGSDLGLQMRPVDELRATRLKVTERRAVKGRGRRASAIWAMIGFARFSGFRSTTRNLLSRSTIVVTFAGPNFCRKSTRSASQWPNSRRPATASGRNRMLRSEENFGGGRLRRRYPRRLRRPETRQRHSSAERSSVE